MAKATWRVFLGIKDHQTETRPGEMVNQGLLSVRGPETHWFDFKRHRGEYQLFYEPGRHHPYIELDGFNPVLPELFALSGIQVERVSFRISVRVDSSPKVVAGRYGFESATATVLRDGPNFRIEVAANTIRDGYRLFCDIMAGEIEGRVEQKFDPVTH